MPFSFMRSLPFGTQYAEHKTAVTVDVLEAGWVAAFVLLAVSLYVLVPGKPRRVYFFCRVTLTLGLGLIIMACNFGHQWEVGSVRTVTPYRAGSAGEVEADVGVKFGLRGVNITLKAVAPPTGDLENEKIDYNEQFSWVWAQGRLGFGPFAGRLQQSYRRHQYRGSPLPILWVAEYFTFDGEGIRFGRHYRVAGWYAHICMWAALPAWLLTVLLFNMVAVYGAAMLTLTGACLTTSALLWCSVRNPVELAIPFSPPDGILTTHYGLHWYLALVTGLLCMSCGTLLLILCHTSLHDDLCLWLGIIPHAYLDEEYGEESTGVRNLGMENTEVMGSFPLKTIRPPKREGAQRQGRISLRAKARGGQSNDASKSHVLTPEQELHGLIATPTEMAPRAPVKLRANTPPAQAGAGQWTHNNDYSNDNDAQYGNDDGLYASMEGHYSDTNIYHSDAHALGVTSPSDTEPIYSNTNVSHGQEQEYQQQHQQQYDSSKAVYENIG